MQKICPQSILINFSELKSLVGSGRPLLCIPEALKATACGFNEFSQLDEAGASEGGTCCQDVNFYPVLGSDEKFIVVDMPGSILVRSSSFDQEIVCVKPNVHSEKACESILNQESVVQHKLASEGAISNGSLSTFSVQKLAQDVISRPLPEFLATETDAAIVTLAAEIEHLAHPQKAVQLSQRSVIGAHIAVEQHAGAVHRVEETSDHGVAPEVKPTDARLHPRAGKVDLKPVPSAPAHHAIATNAPTVLTQTNAQKSRAGLEPDFLNVSDGPDTVLSGSVETSHSPRQTLDRAGAIAADVGPTARPGDTSTIAVERNSVEVVLSEARPEQERQHPAMNERRTTEPETATYGGQRRISAPVVRDSEHRFNIVESSNISETVIDSPAGASVVSAASRPIQSSQASVPAVVIAQFQALEFVSSVRTVSTETIEIVLQPEELGRVRVTLSGTEATMTVVVAADRFETYDLIRRNLDLLARDLADAGYDSVEYQFETATDPGLGRHQSDAENEPSAPVENHDAGPDIARPKLTKQHDGLNILI